MNRCLPVRPSARPRCRAGVLAGSENGLGAITVEATRVKDGTVLDQVIGIVARAQQRRVTLERITDRIAKWFVPIVLLIAIGTFGGWWAFGPAGSAFTYASICAVGVLIVACPCAVGLASPAAVAAGMRRAARSGLIFRDPATLERLSSVDTVLFDKTGTLTEGRPKFIAVAGNRGVSENAALALAAAVERGNDHPLGLAIVWEAVRRKLANRHGRERGGHSRQGRPGYCGWEKRRGGEARLPTGVRRLSGADVERGDVAPQAGTRRRLRRGGNALRRRRRHE